MVVDQDIEATRWEPPAMLSNDSNIEASFRNVIGNKRVATRNMVNSMKATEVGGNSETIAVKSKI